LAPAASDRLRRGSRHFFAKRRSNASLAWFSAGGAVTETFNAPAATPSIRPARARGVSRTATRTPSFAVVSGGSEQWAQVLVN
jgi:hypothetical protein